MRGSGVVMFPRNKLKPQVHNTSKSGLSLLSRWAGHEKSTEIEGPVFSLSRPSQPMSYTHREAKSKDRTFRTSHHTRRGYYFPSRTSQCGNARTIRHRSVPQSRQHTATETGSEVRSHSHLTISKGYYSGNSVGRAGTEDIPETELRSLLGSRSRDHTHTGTSGAEAFY